jgi:dipeptidyl aminopeptidase/acylaminoacyl peptidase
MPGNQDFDLDRFLALPRVDDLALSPDGRRLVAAVAQLDAAGKRYITSLWALDPAGEHPPVRLTRSVAGERGAAFLADGSLLFISSRRDPQVDAADAESPSSADGLWLLPAAGGEARPIAVPPGGVDAVRVAATTGTIVIAVQTHPGTTDWQEDIRRQQERDEAEVAAQLFERYPIRHWDRYLGPRERRLYAAAPPPPERGLEPTDLTPDPGRALDDVEFGPTYDVTPDGTTVVTGWWRDTADPEELAIDLAAIDVATRERRLLAADGRWYVSPACSPDSRQVVCVRADMGTPAGPGDWTLWLCDLDGDGGRDLLEGFDRWPANPVWAPGGQAVYFLADDHGHTLPFRMDLASGAVTRLADAGAFANLTVAPDGSTLYALRSAIDRPPVAVALDPSAADQEPRAIPTPGDDIASPGRVERVVTRAGDGAAVGSWLVLPPAASEHDPAPLVVFIHGGPFASWSGWHWRWNPHVLAARGYAVLLPDPALSTGYGLDFIRRGWGRWGDEPYTDLMAAVDAACDRADVDGDRTAAAGGSFGGYMANWVAGHTGRFRAIVTHASLWALEYFHGTTDLGVWWEREFGDPYVDPSRYRRHSPDRHVAAITTPMLVVHGQKDFRVPIGEALKLWTDLARHGVDAKFLYFPDEHHWVLKPQNARVWYETVIAFLDHHVLGADWKLPPLL